MLSLREYRNKADRLADFLLGHCRELVAGDQVLARVEADLAADLGRDDGVVAG